MALRGDRAIGLLGVIAGLLLAPLAGAQDSPLFQGTTADFWLVDGETGQVTGYDKGQWITRFIAAEYVGLDLTPDDVLLVNRLDASSVPMRGGQPVISLAGLGDAALQIGAGGDGGHRDLTLAPATGTHADTIAVVIGVSGSVLAAGPARLTWTVTESGSTLVDTGKVLDQGPGVTGENGYYYETFHLVNSGSYSVAVQLQGANATVNTSAVYTLAIEPGRERRDTDGDGIPDAVEVDIGLDPLEDDWTADTDGDGWSEFDEWLRRFCLDPATREPVDGDTGCLDADGLPLDSDRDGWSDFDEILRGTNHLDPEPEILPQEPAPPPNSLKIAGGESLQLAPTIVDSALFCTDGSLFYFDVRFYAEADWTNPDTPSDVIFGVGADSYPFANPREAIRANFDENGAITRQSPTVFSSTTATETPPDRWLDGPIADFTIEEGDPFNWHVFGSVPVGTEPFIAGDVVARVAIRSGLSGEGGGSNYPVSGNIADCAAGGPPPPEVALSEYEARQRLRFKDYPAARRLYEVEYHVEAGSGVLSVPPIASILPDQQSAGSNQGAYGGIVVQSVTPAQDNIAGIDFRIAADPEAGEDVEDIIVNLWTAAPRTGDLLLTTRVQDVEINGDPDRPVVVRFEPVAVQPGQPVYIEFRKRRARLVTTGTDTLGGGGVIEIDGAAADGTTDLVIEVHYDAGFAEGIGGTRAGFQWWTVGAAALDGTLAYDATRLLHDSDITAAGLAPPDIVPRRRMTSLATALGASRLPEMRLPGGDSVVVSAVHRHSVPDEAGWRAPADYSRIYKTWLARNNDVTPIAMLDEIGEGSWTTPEEWRRQFIAYIVPRIVVPVGITLDAASTIEVSVIEAALSEEAAIDGSGDLQLLARPFQPGQPIYEWQPSQPVYGNLVTNQSPYVDAWEDNLVRLASDRFTLDQSLAGLASLLGIGQPLESLADWLRTGFYRGLPGTASDEYLAVRLRRSFDDSCFVRASSLPDRQADIASWNDFLDRCPVWFDEAGLATRLAEDRERRYRVRLNLLPGADVEVAEDATLLDRTFDSDVDGKPNGAEVEVPIRRLTLPWAFDSDGDLISDADDICPNDPFNDCSASPIPPTVVIEADFSVFEPNTGSDFALVAVQLNRRYDIPVTVCYEAFVDSGDTATAGEDFEAITGCVVIAPGQQSALVRVPVLADGAEEGPESFTVRITSVDNGTVADDGVVVVTLNDPAPVANTPPVFTSPAAHDATSGNVATGYTATVTDIDGDTITFSTSGGVDQAQFIIDATSGALSFVATPNFDAPADANGDNSYEVQLTADDGNGGTDTLDLVVTVVSAQLEIRMTFPTSGANLGGGVSSTLVAGSVSYPSGATIDPAAVSYINVDGVNATIDKSDATHWRWSAASVPVSDGPNNLVISYGLADGPVFTWVESLQNFQLVPGFDDIAVDAANGRAIALDAYNKSLIAVDLASGGRTLLSGSGIGSGVALNSPRDVVLDEAAGRALVADWQLDAVVAVDLATGNRSYLSSPTVGSGPRLDGAQSLAIDSINARVLVGTTVGSVVFSVDLATGNRSVFSGAEAGAGPLFASLRHVIVDRAGGRALVSDGNLQAIFSVDLATGDRSILSDASTGAGPALISPEVLELDVANNRLLVASTSGFVIAVDLATGNRTTVIDLRPEFEVNQTRFDGIALDAAGGRFLVSDSQLDVIFSFTQTNFSRSVLTSNSTGSGAPLTALWGVQGLAFDVDRDQLLLTRSGIADSVLAVDLANASRRIVSDPGTGTGPIFDFPQDITVDRENSRAFLPGGSNNAIFAVDLASGDRSVISDNTGTGTGPAYAYLRSIAVDSANDRGLVLDSQVGVMSLQLSSGNRSIAADASTGSGPIWSFPNSLVADWANDSAFVIDSNTDALYRMDLVTGNRVIVSDNAGIGTGPTFSTPNDMALDSINNRVVVIDYGFGSNAVMSVDLASGDRALVSGAGIGSGADLLNPYYIALDAANGRIFVYDIAVGGVFVIDLATGQRAIAAKY